MFSLKYRPGLIAIVFSLLSSVVSAQQTLSPQDDPALQRVEPFQVFDNLYYVGAKWVSAWLLETSQGLILFDTLYDGLVDNVIDSIRELGFDPDDIRYVVVTHAHFDHIGGAKRIQEEFGAVVLMTDEDWDIAEGEPIYRPYPKPLRPPFAIGDGDTLNLGEAQLSFYKTPGHTTGVLSTVFTVRDNGLPQTAFMFGGVGLNFSGVERTQMYIDSVKRIMTIPNISVNIPNHEGSGDVFARYQQLQQRQSGDDHSFVDPDGFDAWLDELLLNAEAKLVQEQAAAGQ